MRLTQDFWKCYNNLPPIEKLRFKSSFHLMKSGISPLWEDPKNANGGFWAMRVRKDDTYPFLPQHDTPHRTTRHTQYTAHSTQHAQRCQFSLTREYCVRVEGSHSGAHR
jgi:hypothetical protein